jgi:hypothetical protein
MTSGEGHVVPVVDTPTYYTPKVHHEVTLSRDTVRSLMAAAFYALDLSSDDAGTAVEMADAVLAALDRKQE